MDWKQLAPYLAVLLAVALFARRLIRSQSPRAVRTSRLWIFPAILLVLTGVTLVTGPRPPLIALAAFVAAACAGGALGWFRVHTLEFSVDPESGAVMSKSTPFGAFLIVGLLLFRYALRYFEAELGIRGPQLLLWTEGLLLFLAAMMVAQSIHTWVQARRLAPAPAALPKE
ncbi:MAG: CcdC protein domain-containing protein [Rhizomicrobium sp.]|jgi:hypothetical protein